MSKNIAFHLFLAVCCVPLFAAESPPNVALEKKYTLFPAPTYGHCTDPDDIVQLTDGKTTSQLPSRNRICVSTFRPSAY